MGLWDKLRHASDYLRRLRLSLGPDSYFQYKRGRRSEGKRAREQAAASTQRNRAEEDRGREKAEREREYDERYSREREDDAAQERTKRPEEIEPEARPLAIGPQGSHASRHAVIPLRRDGIARA